MEELLKAQNNLNNYKIANPEQGLFNLGSYKLAPKPVKNKSKNLRNQQMFELLEIINPPRLKEGFKEISGARLAKMLKDAGISDIDLFIGSLKDAKNPSKFFWWKIKDLKSKNI